MTDKFQLKSHMSMRDISSAFVSFNSSIEVASVSNIPCGPFSAKHRAN